MTRVLNDVVRVRVKGEGERNAKRRVTATVAVPLVSRLSLSHSMSSLSRHYGVHCIALHCTALPVATPVLR